MKKIIKKVNNKIVIGSLIGVLTIGFTIPLIPYFPKLSKNNKVNTPLVGAQAFYNHFGKAVGTKFLIQDATNTNYYLSSSTIYNKSNPSIIAPVGTGFNRWNLLAEAGNGFEVIGTTTNRIKGTRATDEVNNWLMGETNVDNSQVNFHSEDSPDGRAIWNILVNDSNQVAFQANPQATGSTPGRGGWITSYSNSSLLGNPPAGYFPNSDGRLPASVNPTFFNIVWLGELNSNTYFDSIIISPTTNFDVDFTFNLKSGLNPNNRYYFAPYSLDDSVNNSPEFIYLDNLGQGGINTITKTINFEKYLKTNGSNILDINLNSLFKVVGPDVVDYGTILNSTNNPLTFQLNSGTLDQISMSIPPTVNQVVLEFDTNLLSSNTNNLVEYNLYTGATPSANWIEIPNPEINGTNILDLSLQASVNEYNISIRIDGGNVSTPNRFQTFQFTKPTGENATISLVDNEITSLHTVTDVEYQLDIKDGSGNIEVENEYLKLNSNLLNTTIKTVDDWYRAFPELNLGVDKFLIQDSINTNYYLSSSLAYNTNYNGGLVASNALGYSRWNTFEQAGDGFTIQSGNIANTLAIRGSRENANVNFLMSEFNTSASTVGFWGIADGRTRWEIVTNQIGQIAIKNVGSFDTGLPGSGGYISSFDESFVTNNGRYPLASGLITTDPSWFNVIVEVPAELKNFRSVDSTLISDNLWSFRLDTILTNTTLLLSVFVDGVYADFLVWNIGGNSEIFDLKFINTSSTSINVTFQWFNQWTYGSGSNLVKSTIEYRYNNGIIPPNSQWITPPLVDGAINQSFSLPGLNQSTLYYIEFKIDGNPLNTILRTFSTIGTPGVITNYSATSPSAGTIVINYTLTLNQSSNWVQYGINNKWYYDPNSSNGTNTITIRGLKPGLYSVNLGLIGTSIIDLGIINVQ